MFRSLSLVFIMTFYTFGFALPVAAQADEQQQAKQSVLQTVTLQVDNMTCGSCSFTVKMALKKVDGVQQVSAKYEGDGEGWAKVTFDPGKTNVESLIKATTNAGYPSHL